MCCCAVASIPPPEKVTPDTPLRLEIAAVQLEEIEGVEEGPRLNLGPSAEKVEYSKAAVVADNHFAVDQAGPRLEQLDCFDGRWEPPRPIVSIPGKQAEAGTQQHGEGHIADKRSGRSPRMVLLISSALLHRRSRDVHGSKVPPLLAVALSLFANVS
jgi:hypothetical protein